MTRSCCRPTGKLPNTPNVRIVYFDVDRGHADAPANPEVEYSAFQHVSSRNYLAPGGLEHICTYAKLSIVPQAAIEILEPIEHANRNTTYFALHATILMGATALLGAVMVVAVGAAITLPAVRMGQDRAEEARSETESTRNEFDRLVPPDRVPDNDPPAPAPIPPNR